MYLLFAKLFYALAFFAAAIAAVAAFVAIIIVNVFFLFHLTFNVLIHDKQSPTFCVLELFRFQCVCIVCVCNSEMCIVIKAAKAIIQMF